MNPPGWTPTRARVWIVRYAYERNLCRTCCDELVRAADQHEVDTVEGFRETLTRVRGSHQSCVPFIGATDNWDWAVKEVTGLTM